MGDVLQVCQTDLVNSAFKYGQGSVRCIIGSSHLLAREVLTNRLLNNLPATTRCGRFSTKACTCRCTCLPARPTTAQSLKKKKPRNLLLVDYSFMLKTITAQKVSSCFFLIFFLGGGRSHYEKQIIIIDGFGLDHQLVPVMFFDGSHNFEDQW